LGDPAQAGPGNAGWQRDLSLSHGRVAIVLAKRRANGDALTAFQQGRSIIVRLAERSRDNATLPNNLAWFDSRIAALGGDPSSFKAPQ
jgi:hypothetical protein